MKKEGTFLGIPYDWRTLTGQRLKSRIWNKNDRRLLTPRAYGWGYSINFYELVHRKKLLLLLSVLFLAFVFLLMQQDKKLTKAHSTFENYYAFRGCIQLIKRTNTYGICKTNQGQTIKIVKVHNKWYLDGDLPVCFSTVCL